MQHEFKELKLSDVVVSRTNPRKSFDEALIGELADSIKQIGVIQPIVVRPKGAKYELVCGERRYRACVKLKETDATMATIPASVRELTDEAMLELQITENLQRKDVHPMDEAVALHRLCHIKKMNVKEIAARVGKSPAFVAQRLKLNDLLPEFQTLFFQDKISLKEAMILCKLKKEDQLDIAKRSQQQGSMIRLDDWTLRQYMLKLSDAPFDKEDTTLLKNIPACSACSFNSASNALLFPDQTKAMCLNGGCFRNKSEAYYSREIKASMEDPAVVLISQNWHDNPDKELLKATNGHPIYKSSQYDAVHKPDMPDYDEFDADDFDDENERRAAYDDAVKRYQDQLAEYDKKIESGKYLKAFQLDGSDKGTYKYVTLNKTAAAAKTKLAGGNAETNDINTEVERIRERTKRSEELDGQKVHEKIIEAAGQAACLKKADNNALGTTESSLAFAFMYHKASYSTQEEIRRGIGIKKTSEAEVYNRLMELSPEQKAFVARKAMYDEFKNSTPKYLGGMLMKQLAHEVGADIRQIELEQEGIAAARKERADKRIAALKAKAKELKDAQPAPKKTTAKKPAKATA